MYQVIEGRGVRIKAWTRGVPVEDVARQQLLNVASLPFIFKHVAAMPDVHWGRGATVGSVIPTNGAIIPEGTNANDINIARNSGSPIYTKYQLELRHPVMLNDQATVFVLGFAEAGNTWNHFRDYNPFKMRRTAGVGARIFLPIFGLLGIDYGHAFDPIPGISNGQWRQNFTFSIMQQMGGFN